MMMICQLHSMHLQKEVKSNQKQPSFKKDATTVANKDVKFKVVAKKWL